MQIKISTKAVAGVILSTAAVLQNPTFAGKVSAVVTAHPHLSIALTGLTLVTALLHNPQFCEAVGLKLD